MHNKQRQTQNPHNQWEAHQTADQQQQNQRLRTGSNLSHRGDLMHFTGTKSLP